MKKRIGYLLMLAGFVILFFVWKESSETTSKQEEMIKQMEALATEQKQPGSDGDGGGSVFELPEVDGKQVIGVLTIPRIDLKVAIVEGATLADIKNAVGHLSESGKLGVVNNNFVILGHNSHTSGQFFDRLDELEPGDQYTIQTPSETYEYTIFKRQIISPAQLEVLEPIKDRSIVTLITCYPNYSSKQRLVLFAEKNS